MATHQQHRRQFISKLSTLGLSSFLPFGNLLKAGTTGGTDPEKAVACTVIPSETRGPYPLFDSSAIASQTALVRSNIKESQTGVPLTLTITVTDSNCNAITNAQVYIWHCTKAGLYSGYSTSNNAGQAGTTYLRGIQTTNASGQVTFQTIFPGWYMGRLTHIHCEVYINNVLITTSQFAFPLDSVAGSATALVNAANGQSNNTITSYSADNVFSDGYDTQLLTLSGSVANGYTATKTLTLNYTVTPLTLISFTAGLENKSPMLWWITTNETNVSHFEIEQSTHPSKNYSQIGTLSARNNTGESHYSFSLSGSLPADITYFRLKIVDIDGSYFYSGIATLHAETLSKLKLVNTLVNNELLIKHPSIYSSNFVKIISMQGQIVATGKLQEGSTYTRMNVSSIKSGTYILVIENGIDKITTKFYKE